MTHSGWVTAQFLHRNLIMCHSMTWTVCEWYYFISLPASIINHVSSESEWTWFCQGVSLIMSHPMINREWVTLHYLFVREPHQSCLIHDQQKVSNTALFVCQAVSSITSPGIHVKQSVSDTTLFVPGSLINHVSSHDHYGSMWVMALLYLFARQSQSFFMPSPTVCEWHYFICLPHSLINHITSWQTGSEWHNLISVPGSLINPMTNSMWVTLWYFICLPGSLINHVSSSDQQGVSDTVVFHWPGSLMNHVSSSDQQGVSDTALFVYHAVSSIMSCPMTNRQWVILL